MDCSLMRFQRMSWAPPTGARTLVSILLFSILLGACGQGGDTTTQIKNAPTRIVISPSPQSTPTKAPSPTAAASTSPVTWPAFDGGGARSGVNTAETKLTPNNVGKLSRLWQITLPTVADSSPVELPGVSTSTGTKTLLFLTSLSGSLLAIDATTGRLAWRRDTYGPKITNSSPAIDSSGQFVYSYGLDGKVHKYAAGSGNEITSGGWPETITLMNIDEKGSASLNIDKDYLYATTSGYIGDGGHYEGHVVAIKLSNGSKTVFNVLCSNIHQLLYNNPGYANYCPDIRAGIWARAGVVIDPVTGNVFVTSGNGPFNANAGGYDYGDTIIELSADVTKLVDTYTPLNYASLEAADADLGSASPALLPRQAGSSTPYMAVQANKSSVLQLINRQNLSGMHGPNHVGGELQVARLPQGCNVPTQPAVWNDTNNVTWIFVANDCGFSAFKVVTDANGHSSLQLAYRNGITGSSPFVANGILFIQGYGAIRALNPTTGAVIWNAAIGQLHWQSPIVVNGHVYVTDMSGNLTAFGLK